MRKTCLQFNIEILHTHLHLTFRSCRHSSTIKIPFKWNSRFAKNTWSASTKSSSCFFDTSFTTDKIMIMLMEQIIFSFKLLFYIIHFVSSFNTFPFLLFLKFWVLSTLSKLHLEYHIHIQIHISVLNFEENRSWSIHCLY